MPPRTPTLVGVAQLEQRCEDPLAAREPLLLMEDALRAAALDAGCPALLEQADALYVIRGIWPYRNPGRLLRERLGALRARTWATPFGGNLAQSCVSHAALAIQRGECEIALITGAEIGHTQARARKAGLRLAFTDAPGQADARVAPEKPMVAEHERALGLEQPIQLYPIFESALRHRAGLSHDEHRRKIAQLWSQMSEVAARNPHAWLRRSYTPDEIRLESPDNRMVGYPYTKRLCSNNAVDQAAALILCSADAARRLGIARDRCVWPCSGSEGHDTDFVSQRQDLCCSPAIRIAGHRALELAGRSLAQIRWLDVYSCFPSAVQVAMHELGIEEQRCPTFTGGLTFAGGPLNSYVLHAIAALVLQLRQEPGTAGLITANGGFLTKHAFGVYTGEPPDAFRHADVQADIDALPQREPAVDYAGEIEIEGCTVMHGPQGPQLAYACGLTDDGRRAWARSEDRALMQAMMQEELCGRRARLEPGGALHVK